MLKHCNDGIAHWKRKYPSIDDLEIVSLKRRKLLVKDELARLKN